MQKPKLEEKVAKSKAKVRVLENQKGAHHMEGARCGQPQHVPLTEKSSTMMMSLNTFMIWKMKDTEGAI